MEVLQNCFQGGRGQNIINSFLLKNKQKDFQKEA
jgi:hypothetical protein